MHLTNAGQASYAPAWKGYQACASYDLEDWFRCVAMCVLSLPGFPPEHPNDKRIGSQMGYACTL